MQTNLGLFLAKRAHLSPKVEAVVEVERGRRFTYAELDARANRIANVLREKGVRKGDRVALLLMNGVEYIEAYFGAAKIGAVTVPLNWRLVPDELEFIIGDSGAIVLIWGEEFDEAVSALQPRGLPVREWIRLGERSGLPGWAVDYDELCGNASTDEPPIEGDTEDLLFIMYTSGTTGLPKGAVHTNGTMAWASLTINMTADMRYRDRYLQMLPLFHVGALTPATAAIHRGGSLIVMRAFDPTTVFQVIERERITIGLAVPAMLNFSAGPVNVLAAMKAAQVKTVLTSKAFIEKGKLEKLMTAISAEARVVYLEDVRASIGTADKIKGLLAGTAPRIVRQANDAAVVLFTSGSEGTPKGVVLSHRNILANAAQALARVDANANDKVFNVLPVFHSFGLTGGMMMPMLAGIPIYMYPSPLHYRIVPELIYQTGATILFGTDTFLTGYARSAHAYDFRTYGRGG